jgi:hypothetical protein
LTSKHAWDFVILNDHDSQSNLLFEKKPKPRHYTSFERAIYIYVPMMASWQEEYYGYFSYNDRLSKAHERKTLEDLGSFDAFTSQSLAARLLYLEYISKRLSRHARPEPS